MSWLSKNYEKITLGAAAAIAIAVVVVGFRNKGQLAEAFQLSAPKQNTETGVAGLAATVAAKTSLETEHEIRQADVDGRKVKLFTGVPLYAKKDDLKDPVDLLKSDPVHPGIANTWWAEYDIDPGYSDSPDRDPDSDGFTNREEHDAETDPTDPDSYPEPVTKLAATGIKTTQVHIKPTAADPGAEGKQSTFKLETKGGSTINKMKLDPVSPGNIIPFVKPLMQNRFKFAGLDKRQNPNRTVDIIWVIEDLQPNKKGTSYRFDKRGDLDGHPRRALGIMDSKVELTLQAMGQEDKPFEVEENTYFSLPYDEKAANKPYLLKAVDQSEPKAEVEYTDKGGNKQIHIMPIRKN